MHGNINNADSAATHAQDGSGPVFGISDSSGAPSHALIANRKFWFAIMCFALWGVSAPAALFDLVGQILGYEDDRQCRRWARGETVPDAPILWLLLRSREGDRVLAFIQSHEPPDWYLKKQQEHDLASLALEIFTRAGVIMNSATALSSPKPLAKG